ncbi:hypothetical protein HK101_011368 [Irineochytrium annulatum]|nr:hypothetical protein HK101_011368 [Irineochytrium annulatum]
MPHIPHPTTPRFISYNIPNLHYVEDHPIHGCVIPTRFEQRDALRSIAQLGGRVTRTYCLGVLPKNDTSSLRHVACFPDEATPRPKGTWNEVPGASVRLFLNEDLMRALDEAIRSACELGVKLIIPIMDRWHWWGGMEVFCQLHGRPISKFFVDQAVRRSYVAVLTAVLNRVNTITGVRYGDDPTVLGWETGNELESVQGGVGVRVPGEWTVAMARVVKGLVKQGLGIVFVDGSYGIHGWDEAVLECEDVHVISNHYYQGAAVGMSILGLLTCSGGVVPGNFAERMRRDAKVAEQAGKWLLVGEVGLTDVEEMEDLLDECVREKSVLGALVWSLRFHANDGGFYVHAESGAYWSYHHPGFHSRNAPGFPDDEYIMAPLVARIAARMSGSPCSTYIPEPAPEIIESNSTSRNGFRWRGSTGAAWYNVQRALKSEEGPFQDVEERALDTRRPGEAMVFDRDYGEGFVGAWYRVRGVNAAGMSAWSKAVWLNAE